MVKDTVIQLFLGLLKNCQF